ncbi:MAG: hypothetical protein ACI8SR_000001, partial [Oceanicoccus sp.]
LNRVFLYMLQSLDFESDLNLYLPKAGSATPIAYYDYLFRTAVYSYRAFTASQTIY